MMTMNTQPTSTNPILPTSRSLHILVVAGHRNTSGGDPRESARTPSLARAVVAALKQAGHRADLLQDSDDTWFDGTLDDVALSVVARHRHDPIDLMLDMHFEGDASNTHGVFAIVPDGDGLHTITAYDGSDCLDANPLDHAFARAIANGIAATTGLPLRTGLVEPGVMSEKQTYVGADLGWRLAMFGYTAPVRERMARLVVECGNLYADAECIARPEFDELVGQGIAQGIRAVLDGGATVPETWPRFGTLRRLPEPRLVTVTVDALNARHWAELSAPIRATWRCGRTFWARAIVIGDEVDGNPVWWITGKGSSIDQQWRVWSGGTDLSGRDALDLVEQSGGAS